MAAESRPVADHIAGPISGFYLGAYAVPGEEGYVGYAKVFTARPQSTWDGTPAVRKLSAGPCPTELSAICTVIQKAEWELAEAGCDHLLWEEAISPVNGG